MTIKQQQIVEKLNKKLEKVQDQYHTYCEVVNKYEKNLEKAKQMRDEQLEIIHTLTDFLVLMED